MIPFVRFFCLKAAIRALVASGSLDRAIAISSQSLYPIAFLSSSAARSANPSGSSRYSPYRFYASSRVNFFCFINPLIVFSNPLGSFIFSIANACFGPTTIFKVVHEDDDDGGVLTVLLVDGKVTNASDFATISATTMAAYVMRWRNRDIIFFYAAETGSKTIQ